MSILQVGCGVGNTAYPLLELNQCSQVYACDFAPSAVELVKANPQYSSGRIHAFVADITCHDLRAEVPARSVDICTMVFVLSAITPTKMPAVRAACCCSSCSMVNALSCVSLRMDLLYITNRSIMSSKLCPAETTHTQILVAYSCQCMQCMYLRVCRQCALDIEHSTPAYTATQTSLHLAHVSCTCKFQLSALQCTDASMLTRLDHC